MQQGDKDIVAYNINSAWTAFDLAPYNMAYNPLMRYKMLQNDKVMLDSKKCSILTNYLVEATIIVRGKKKIQFIFAARNTSSHFLRVAVIFFFSNKLLWLPYFNCYY